MSTILIHRRVTEEQIQEYIATVISFFESNPDREDCILQAPWGSQYAISKNSIEEDIKDMCN